MAYTFKSRSAPSVTLLRANGEEILRIIGKLPAELGVIPLEAMPAAIAALETAMLSRSVVPGASPAAPQVGDERAARHEADDAEVVVTLRQRAQPFLHLLRQAQSEGEPVTWGVV